MALQIHSWKRLWFPREGRGSLADGGFLLDPKSELAGYEHTDVVPFDSISGTRCLVLLGEPGIGKSTALKSEFAVYQQADIVNAGFAAWVDLGDFSSEEAIERAIAASDDVRN